MALIAAWPLPATAHLVTTGLGPLYDGVGHAFISLGELLPLLALCLLGGLHGANDTRAARWIVLLWPPAWLLGAVFGARAGLMLPSTGEAAVLALAALVPALLVVIDTSVPGSLLRMLAVALGLLLGAIAGNGLATQADLALLLVGSLIAQSLLLILLSGALVAALRPPHAAWRRVVVRVAASWIGAVGLLMLGWLAR